MAAVMTLGAFTKACLVVLILSSTAAALSVPGSSGTNSSGGSGAAHTHHHQHWPVSTAAAENSADIESGQFPGSTLSASHNYGIEGNNRTNGTNETEGHKGIDNSEGNDSGNRAYNETYNNQGAESSNGTEGNGRTNDTGQSAADQGQQKHSEDAATMTWGSVMREAMTIVVAYCKSQRLCNASAWTSQPPADFSLCHECFCDDGCYAREDCCMDMQLIEVKDKPVSHSPASPPTLYGCHNVFYGNHATGRYSQQDFFFHKLIDRCPDNWHDEDVSRRCSNISDTDLLTRWPMTSSATGSVYRNEYCGRCHDELFSQLERWDVVMGCLEPLDISDLSSAEAVARRVISSPGCTLSFEAPKGSWAPKCESTAMVYVSTCQRTAGQSSWVMAQMPWWLSHACRTFHGLFTTKERYYNAITYRNLFCAHCNEPGTLDANARSAPLTGNTPYPFLLVVSSRALTSIQPDTLQSCPLDCPTGFVYDRFQSQCRELQCSITKVLVNQRCVPHVHTGHGIGYEVTVRLSPVNETFFTIKILPMLTLSILITFEKKLYDSGYNSSFFKMDSIRVFAIPRAGHNQSSFQIVPPGLFGGKADFTAMHVGIGLSAKLPVALRRVEQALLETTRSTWTVSSDLGSIISFQSSAAYTPKQTQEHELVTPTLTSLGAGTSAYMINLFLSWSNVTHNKVQETLHCPKVAFELTQEGTMDRAIEDDQQDTVPHSIPGPQGHTAQQADTHITSRRVLQSMSADTGQVVVSVDPDTGWLFHHPSARPVHWRHVELLERDGVVLVCAEQLYGTVSNRRRSGPEILVVEKFFSWYMIYASVACQSLSVVCLFLVLLTYSLFAELRTLPGKNTMGLVSSLLMAMLLFEVGVARVEFPLLCVLIGVAIHLCLLSALTWMVICSTHMYRVFSRAVARSVHQVEEDQALYLKHVTLSVLIPALIVILTLTANGLTNQAGCGLDLGYGKGICYLSNTWSLVLASVLPVCGAVLVNLALFAVTVYALRSLSHDLKEATQQHRQQLAVYIRLSTLTGINWLAGLMAAVVHSVVVWYVFVVLCGLQGVYIFLAFVCNRRVLEMYRFLMRVSDFDASRTRSSRGADHDSADSNDVYNETAMKPA